jgi:hypothetical protein
VLKPPDPNAKTQSKSIPPIPQGSSVSNAALAVASPLDGGRPLGIADNNWQRDPSSWQGVQTASGTILRPPEPLADSVASPKVQVVPVPQVTAPAAIPPASADELMARLIARTAWQRQEVTAAGWRVVCGVRSPTNPDLQRVYEATGPTPNAAVQAVLDQIDGRQ